MAEVGQRLGNGVYRLSALKTGQSRTVSSGGGRGCLLINCSSSLRPVNEETVPGQLLSDSRTRRKSGKLYRVIKSETLQENVVFLCATSLEPRSLLFIGSAEPRESLQTHKPALQLSSSSAGLLQDKLLPCRMTPWTRRAISIHPVIFRSPQHLRGFRTVVFIRTEQRPGCGRRRLKLQLEALLKASAATRSYSWSSEDAPLLHRSRTAYYDILKVSPTATQSQIKTAYYKQSFIYHPDKNLGSKEATHRFSEISEAYTVLGNISLRRKYDRGILSQSDIQSAGRPSSKEATSRSTSSTQQQQHQRARRFSQAGGKPIFDFDTFYQAHYGEQLQRERDMKARKQHMEEMQKKRQSKWREHKLMELSLTLLVAMGGLIFVCLSRP